MAPAMSAAQQPKEKVFSCYLLRSSSVKGPGRTYIGFTVSPLRRLRQHNGEIKGGARKTSRWKPWELVLVVHGFSNSIIALQFEYAWQHPERSRLLRQSFAEHVNRRRAASLEAKMVVLLLALRTAPFSSQPLGVHLFDSALERRPFDSRQHARLLAGEMHLPEIPMHMLARLTCGDASACPELSRAAAGHGDDDNDDDDDDDGRGGDGCGTSGEEEDDEEGRMGAGGLASDGETSPRILSQRLGASAAPQPLRPIQPEACGAAGAAATGAASAGEGCALCAAPIVRAVVACACGLRAHPVCLAARLIPPDDDRSLIPIGGICPRCGIHAFWPDLVRRGAQLRGQGPARARVAAPRSQCAAALVGSEGAANCAGRGADRCAGSRAGDSATASSALAPVVIDLDLAGDSSASEADEPARGGACASPSSPWPRHDLRFASPLGGLTSPQHGLTSPWVGLTSPRGEIDGTAGGDEDGDASWEQDREDGRWDDDQYRAVGDGIGTQDAGFCAAAAATAAAASDGSEDSGGAAQEDEELDVHTHWQDDGYLYWEDGGSWHGSECAEGGLRLPLSPAQPQLPPSPLQESRSRSRSPQLPSPSRSSPRFGRPRPRALPSRSCSCSPMDADEEGADPARRVGLCGGSGGYYREHAQSASPRHTPAPGKGGSAGGSAGAESAECEDEGSGRSEGADDDDGLCYDMRPLAERLGAWPLHSSQPSGTSSPPQSDLPSSGALAIGPLSARAGRRRSPRASPGKARLPGARAHAAGSPLPLAMLGLSRTNAIVLCDSSDEDGG